MLSTTMMPTCKSSAIEQRSDDIKYKPIRSDRFQDGWKEVGFEVIDDSKAYAGVIKLPIHAFSSSPVLRPGDQTARLHFVGLGSESTIQIRLSNVLGDMGVTIDPEAIVSTEQEDLWASMKIVPVRISTGLHLEKGETEQLFDLKLQPKPFEALTASLPPLRADQPQGSVIVNVNYRVDHGGVDRRLELELPIRFVPSIWSLFTLVCGGACIGILFGFILPGQNHTKVSGKAFSAAITLGLIVEIVAMVLVSNDSKLVILGFELNPFQLLTSLLVGFFSGLMVAWRAEAIRSFFDKVTDRVGSKDGT
jgi:hypothetical protein